MIPSINTDVTLWTGIWRTWRSIPNELTSAIVGFDAISHDFDVNKWSSYQVRILDSLLRKMGQGVLVSYDHDSIKRIKSFDLKILKTKKNYDILWLNWFPFFAKRSIYFLNNSHDLQVLVESILWAEYTDNFILFANNIDDQMIKRFLKKEWTKDDQFISIAPIDDYPSWIVITNYLDRHDLEEVLKNLTANL